MNWYLQLHLYLGNYSTEGLETVREGFDDYTATFRGPIGQTRKKNPAYQAQHQDVAGWILYY